MGKSIVYIIDTCYLVELFKIPGHYNDASALKIKNKFESAINHKSRLVVPFPCVFELANHIAHVTDGAIRKSLSLKLYNTVSSSISSSNPWIIPPYSGIESVLVEICKVFSERYVTSMIGLTDTYIIMEANKWKSKNNDPKYKVHIWTLEPLIKAYEPDTEPDPFCN